mmetsp:Transcript_1588/g.2027  ORF Transcript_1588/g.2027 Transcript_1588/m.2027 type:complete len:405 (-) Transcript_1588:219-1433(-)
MLRINKSATDKNGYNRKDNNDTLLATKETIPSEHISQEPSTVSNYILGTFFIYAFRVKQQVMSKFKRKHQVFIIILFLAISSSIVSQFTSETSKHQSGFAKTLYSGDYSSQAHSLGAPISPPTKAPPTRFHKVVPQRTMGQDFLSSLEIKDQVTDEEQIDVTSVDKMLVHDGSIEISATKKDVENLTNEIVSFFDDGKKGYIENNSKHSSHDSRLHVNLSLRVLSSEFHSMMASIQSMIKDKNNDKNRNNKNKIDVRSVSSSIVDVTDQYVDVASRANTLKTAQKAMTALLERSNTVDEIISIQRELNSLTQEYESKKSRVEHLKKQVDLSHLLIILEEKVNVTTEPVPSSYYDDWSPWTAFWSALNHLQRVTFFGANVVIYATVWAVPVFIVVSVIKFVIGPV